MLPAPAPAPAPAPLFALRAPRTIVVPVLAVDEAVLAALGTRGYETVVFVAATVRWVVFRVEAVLVPTAVDAVAATPRRDRAEDAVVAVVAVVVVDALLLAALVREGAFSPPTATKPRAAVAVVVVDFCAVEETFLVVAAAATLVIAFANCFKGEPGLDMVGCRGSGFDGERGGGVRELWERGERIFGGTFSFRDAVLVARVLAFVVLPPLACGGAGGKDFEVMSSVSFTLVRFFGSDRSAYTFSLSTDISALDRFVPLDVVLAAAGGSASSASMLTTTSPPYLPPRIRRT